MTKTNLAGGKIKYWCPNKNKIGGNQIIGAPTKTNLADKELAPLQVVDAKKAYGWSDRYIHGISACQADRERHNKGSMALGVPKRIKVFLQLAEYFKINIIGNGI